MASFSFIFLSYQVDWGEGGLAGDKGLLGGEERREEGERSNWIA